MLVSVYQLASIDSFDIHEKLWKYRHNIYWTTGQPRPFDRGCHHFDLDQDCCLSFQLFCFKFDWNLTNAFSQNFTGSQLYVIFEPRRSKQKIKPILSSKSNIWLTLRCHLNCYKWKCSSYQLIGDIRLAWKTNVFFPFLVSTRFSTKYQMNIAIKLQLRQLITIGMKC